MELKAWKATMLLNAMAYHFRQGEKKVKSALSAMNMENKETIQAMPNSHTVNIAAFAANVGVSIAIPRSHMVRVLIGSMTASEGRSPENLMRMAEIAALKLQSILKGGKDTKKSNN